MEAVDLRALAPEARDGRLTLVRVLGPRGGRRLFAACLLGAYALLVAAAVPRDAPHGALAALFSLPAASVPLTGGLRARTAATLDLVIASTLRAYGLFVLWLIAGLVLGALYLRLLRLTGG